MGHKAEKPKSLIQLHKKDIKIVCLEGRINELTGYYKAKSLKLIPRRKTETS